VVEKSREAVIITVLVLIAVSTYNPLLRYNVKGVSILHEISSEIENKGYV